MPKILKSKLFLSGISIVMVAVTVVSVVLINTSEKIPIASLPVDSSNRAETSSVSIAPIDEKASYTSSTENETNDEVPSIIDVGGNPVKQTGTTTTAVVDGDSKTISSDTHVSTQKPPSVEVNVTSDSTQAKDTEPNPMLSTNSNYPSNPDDWTPPAPGVGTGELISSGFESIKINTDKSVETMQREIGLLVGSKLLNAGYNTLYPNAGAPQDMVEASVKNYANTGTVTLDSASYGLPKIVGYYNIKLTANGANVAEAGNYIFEYMKNDKVFNDKVKSTFTVYKDGWLSVYQKDGYFYILFAVIDKGYSSFG